MAGSWTTPVAEEGTMKIAAQVLMFAATAGLAVLAVNTRKLPTEQETRQAPVSADSDQWFI